MLETKKFNKTKNNIGQLIKEILTDASRKISSLDSEHLVCPHFFKQVGGAVPQVIN
jgi:hypothetical protein